MGIGGGGDEEAARRGGGGARAAGAGGEVVVDEPEVGFVSADGAKSGSGVAGLTPLPLSSLFLFTSPDGGGSPAAILGLVCDDVCERGKRSKQKEK